VAEATTSAKADAFFLVLLRSSFRKIRTNENQFYAVEREISTFNQAVFIVVQTRNQRLLATVLTALKNCYSRTIQKYELAKREANYVLCR
jgi:hypothetical protein